MLSGTSRSATHFCNKVPINNCRANKEKIKSTKTVRKITSASIFIDPPRALMIDFKPIVRKWDQFIRYIPFDDSVILAYK